MPASRKRLRNAAVATPAPLSATAIRAALTSRCTSDERHPAAWRNAIAAAGVPDGDALLCHVGRSITAALQAVAVTSESARAVLRSTRASLIFAVNSRCDELEAFIAAAESTKVAALERELCTVDAALESWRAERGAVVEAAATLQDDELPSQRAVLTARLDAAEALLHALPTTVVEPPHVGLVADMPALLAGIAALGRVVAPRAITAADLSVTGAPRNAGPCRPLRVCLAVPATHHLSQSADELTVSLGAAAAATLVEASLHIGGDALKPLTGVVTADIPGRCLEILFDVPATATAGASITIASATVYGRPVADAALPLHIPVFRGMRAPLRLQLTFHEKSLPTSMCISSAGELFYPEGGKLTVLVFDADGTPQPGLHVADVGLTQPVAWAAVADSVSPTLILADSNSNMTEFIAVDPATHSVRWMKDANWIEGCAGLAVLPSHGIVVVASYCTNTLFAHRLSTGETVGSLVIPGLSFYLAADPQTGAIYGSVSPGAGKYAVYRALWTPGAEFRAEGVVAAAGETGNMRPLAIVPPAPGKLASHLVVGTQGEPVLHVLSLPSLTLVHTHKLKKMHVGALAADPWGEALAVLDLASLAIVVLAWPLPGMPALA